MWRHGARAILIAGLVSACDGGSNGSGSTRDTGLYTPPDDPSTLPPDELFVTLRLRQFWERRVIEVPWDGGSDSVFGDFTVPLAGVTVCVERVRGRGEGWEAFQDWDERYPRRSKPCVEKNDLAAGTPDSAVVLEGLPPRAELLLIAQKPGYWPSVIPVATDNVDLDATEDDRPSSLFPRDSSWPVLDVGVDPELGIVGLQVFGCVTDPSDYSCTDLAGARLRIEPPVGNGPYYGRGGRYDLSAQQTGSGRPSYPEGWTLRPRNVAVNLPEGEYRFVVEHDLARCWARGRYNAHALFGFPSAEESTVRFPILDGHVTPYIAQNCDCKVDPALGLPSKETCRLIDGDAGAP